MREAGERAQLLIALVALPVPGAPLPPPRVVEPEARTAPAGRGKLTPQTSPWTEVFLGGRRLGETPLIDYPLAAGRHTLRLVNVEAAVSTTVEIEIAAGKTTVKKLVFEQTHSARSAFVVPLATMRRYVESRFSISAMRFSCSSRHFKER